MITSARHSITLEEAIAVALDAGNSDAAAALLRRAFGRPAQAGADDLPELLEELAEYFVSVDRPDDAVAAAGRAVLATPADADPADVLRRRCRMAGIMLRSDLPEEAFAAYTAVLDEAGAATWVHEAAGSDYLDAADYDFAFAWLTAGLELALAKGEPDRCVARLLGLRRMAMGAMDLPCDALDRNASALISKPDTHPAVADDFLLVQELEGAGVPGERALRALDLLQRASSLAHASTIRAS
jgi:tetratricopeptide (TPR) repeat protein